MAPSPNFFIVGAPKCGTTALSAYLAAHPNVYFSNPKEPHYFAADLPFFRRAFADEKRYYDLFRDAGPEHKAIGEASVWYLYSRDAIPAIRDALPESRIVVMLRRPVDMVYSLHGQWLYTQNEDQEDFEAAWRLQAARSEGKSLPRHLRQPPQMLQYGDIGKYSGYIERLFSLFPRQQVRVILFDDLTSDPKSVYDSVLSFLQLPDDGRRKFPRVNVSKVSRFPRLTLWSRNAPASLSRILNANRAVRNLKYSAIRLIDKFNEKPQKRPPLPERFRQELNDYFLSDVQRLESIIERDLSHWYR